MGRSVSLVFSGVSSVLFYIIINYDIYIKAGFFFLGAVSALGAAMAL